MFKKELIHAEARHLLYLHYFLLNLFRMNDVFGIFIAVVYHNIYMFLTAIKIANSSIVRALNSLLCVLAGSLSVLIMTV